jgi:hypothetical protein
MRVDNNCFITYSFQRKMSEDLRTIHENEKYCLFRDLMMSSTLPRIGAGELPNVPGIHTDMSTGKSCGCSQSSSDPEVRNRVLSLFRIECGELRNNVAIHHAGPLYSQRAIRAPIEMLLWHFPLQNKPATVIK